METIISQIRTGGMIDHSNCYSALMHYFLVSRKEKEEEKSSIACRRYVAFTFFSVYIRICGSGWKTLA